MIRIILFAFILILSSSCKHYVFEEQNINTEGYEMYFFPINLPSNFTRDQQPILDSGFVISDNSTIKKIIKTWRFPYSEIRELPSYKLYYSKGNEVYYSFYFNSRLDQLQTGHGNYVFQPKYLLKYKPYFKKLIGYELVFDQLESARECKSVMEINDIFVPFTESDSKFFWEKYSGEIQIKRPQFRIPMDASYNFNDVLINDLNPYLKDFEITQWDYNQKADSITIQAYCNVTISDLPEQYSIVKNLHVFDTISFTVFGLNEENLSRICETNNIKPIRIKEKKY